MTESKQILLVEDDADIAETLLFIFSSMLPGHRVVQVPTAEEAIARLNLKEGPCALILADFQLAGDWNGIDLYKACLTGHPGIPFVLISAADEKRIAAELGPLRPGPVVLHKPFELDHLLGTVQRLLRV